MDLAELLAAATNSPTVGNATAGQNQTTNSGGAEVILAGKYKGQTYEEAARQLEQAYNLQMTGFNQVAAERDALKQQIESIKPLLEGLAAQRSEPGAGSGVRESAVSALAKSLNVEPDQLVAALGEVAAPMVEGALKPFFRNIQAQQIVAAENPDFEKFRPEVAQFLEANPAVKARVAAIALTEHPEAAHEYAYLKMVQMRGRSGVGNPTNNTTTDASGANALNARLDALTPSGAGGGRPQGAGEANLAALEAKARETGAQTDIEAFLNEFMKPFAHPDGIAGDFRY